MSKRAAALRAKYGEDYFRQLGRRGAATTNTVHAERKEEWGRLGFEKIVQERFGGDHQRAKDWLTAKGQFASDPFPHNGAFKDPGPMPPVEGG